MDASTPLVKEIGYKLGSFGFIDYHMIKIKTNIYKSEFHIMSRGDYDEEY